MPRVWLLALPLGIQALVMFVDEFHFHRQRGLPRWERIGHPLDTLTVLVCYGIAVIVPFEASSAAIYVLMAALSCLFVTKDEFVHRQLCGAVEQWLHSLLFILHPVALACIFSWWEQGARTALLLQGSMTLAFGLYQIVYWNTPWLKISAAP